MNKNSVHGSIIDPFYSDGKFLAESRGEKDAEFKITGVSNLLKCFPDIISQVKKIADVGCGTGKTTLLIEKELIKLGCLDISLLGYDIHPEVSTFSNTKSISFVQGDFCLSNQEVDLVFLLDVIEHIPDPIGFLGEIRDRTSWLICHVPLDSSIFSGIRNLHLQNLKHPGHLIVLDLSAALNIIAFAGFRTIYYMYSPVFRAPSNRCTIPQKILFGIRELLYRINPFLLLKTLGGVSLFILAASPNGLSRPCKHSN